MKKYITEKAINRVVEAYQQARAAERKAVPLAVREYFFGKQIGIIEAFGFVTGQEWNVIEQMLRQRADKLDEGKK